MKFSFSTIRQQNYLVSRESSDQGGLANQKSWNSINMPETDIQSVIDNHRRRVEEVQAAHDALEEELKSNGGKGSPITFFKNCIWGSIGRMVAQGQMVDAGHVRSKPYDLYSVDYMENCDQDNYEHYWIRADFEETVDLEEGNPTTAAPLSDETRAGDTVYCRIYASVDNTPNLKPFHAPERLSLETYHLDAQDGSYEIAVQFIGRDYLKMQVPAQLMRTYNHFPVPDSAPEVFEFVGVFRDVSMGMLPNKSKSKKKRNRKGRGKGHRR
ncbi:hypothetical protein GGR53DRAFT_497125 [Hypoxylon sp. FL1150]|nr:hypothetical protein GGR53DRAFT_497125 [Hypoxylon sp. FL1150]